jgi:hypothetical protein
MCTFCEQVSSNRTHTKCRVLSLSPYTPICKTTNMTDVIVGSLGNRDLVAISCFFMFRITHCGQKNMLFFVLCQPDEIPWQRLSAIGINSPRNFIITNTNRWWWFLFNVASYQPLRAKLCVGTSTTPRGWMQQQQLGLWLWWKEQDRSCTKNNFQPDGKTYIKKRFSLGWKFQHVIRHWLP